VWLMLQPDVVTSKPYVFSVIAMQAATLLCPSVWYTDGEMVQALAWYLLVFLATVCPFVLTRLRKGCGLVVALLVAFSVRQLFLMERLNALETEVAAMVEYLNKYEKEHGTRPPDLSGYKFIRPYLAERIEYVPPYDTYASVIVYKLYDGDTT